jgi:antitoxin VapB
MTLRIDDPEADRLAQEVAAPTGETLAEAVKISPAEPLARERQRREARSLAQRRDEIARHRASLPDHDSRSPDEIIGYDEHGAPR